MNARTYSAALILLAASAAHAQTFTFDSGPEGWRIFSIAYVGDHVNGRTSTGQLAPVDNAVGLPAPGLRIADLAGETWIGAPAASLGARSDLVGQSISFDILYRFADNANYASIGIESPTISLYIPEPPPALNTWIHRTYSLTPGLWHVTNINGPLATADDIAGVLADLSGVYIHTEWNTGPDDTSVDNIALGTPPPQCGSADFNCDGDLGTDADIESFFACLAGACPSAPCTSSADFNHDGDLGTDADIEAFFRVLAGGSC